MRMRHGECRNCARLPERLAELESQTAAALARIEELKKQLASARKNSSTSSKPPSSDIVEPTNNAMEQRFRFVVIDRKITQRTRGETGRRWCERIWTVLTTCAQQRRSAFEFLYDSIVAHFENQASPSLLPLPP